MSGRAGRLEHTARVDGGARAQLIASCRDDMPMAGAFVELGPSDLGVEPNTSVGARTSPHSGSAWFVAHRQVA